MSNITQAKQVDSSHYAFADYMDKKRWISTWHQVYEVLRVEPAKVLEIGPGLGLFKSVATIYGVHVETFDIDPDLKPDHLGSVFEMPFEDGEFDAVCAVQMLEHLEFEQALLAVSEMARVSAKALIISLPEATKRYPIQVTVPRLGLKNWHVPYPHLKPIPNSFDGQHYWEIGKDGFSVRRIVAAFAISAGMVLDREFLVPENPRHRFLIYKRKL